MTKKRLLIIGAVPHPDNLKTYGGTTTLMQNFLDYCREHHYAVSHIDTLRFSNKWFNMLYFGLRFVVEVCRCQVVMYNASVNGAFTLFYYTAPLAYALQRRVVFRKYGGNFFSQIEAEAPMKRIRMIQLLNRASVLYFETQVLVERFKGLLARPERIKWFPNCRRPATVARCGEYGRRFVFISHIREEKGVDVLLEAAEALPPGYTVDLYGSIQDERYAASGYFEGKRARYRGALKTEEVLPTLARYDVLVLPTHWKTEGYPGIIIEAMSLGIPTISTPIGGIPELITDGRNGLIIQPHDAEALRQAMLSIDAERYERMAAAAHKRFDEAYNSDVVNAQVYHDMMNL